MMLTLPRLICAPMPLLILTVPLLPIEKLVKSMMPRWLDCVIVSVRPCVPIEPAPATKCPPCGSMFAGIATGEPACAAEAAPTKAVPPARLARKRRWKPVPFRSLIPAKAGIQTFGRKPVPRLPKEAWVPAFGTSGAPPKT